MPAAPRPARGSRAPSLKAQALALLARREHSRAELRTKLLRLVSRQLEGSDQDVDPSTAHDEVEQLLDWLQAQRYQSDERFAESRLHRRASSHGSARIRQELARHQVSLPTEALQELKNTELERARQLWLKRYGTPPQDAKEAARQARFLLSRGFSGEVVRTILHKTPLFDT